MATGHDELHLATTCQKMVSDPKARSPGVEECSSIEHFTWEFLQIEGVSFFVGVFITRALLLGVHIRPLIFGNCHVAVSQHWNRPLAGCFLLRHPRKNYVKAISLIPRARPRSQESLSTLILQHNKPLRHKDRLCRGSLTSSPGSQNLRSIVLDARARRSPSTQGPRPTGES